MKLKETIKSKVDQLNVSDLRIVEILIDSLKDGRKQIRKKAMPKNPPFMKVINLMGSNVLTSDDIHTDRQERI